MELKAALDPSGRAPALASWARGGDPCGRGDYFEGVTCDARGRVSVVSLQGRGLAGATDGIGRAIAFRIAAAGLGLVLVRRNPDPDKFPALARGGRIRRRAPGRLLPAACSGRAPREGPERPERAHDEPSCFRAHGEIFLSSIYHVNQPLHQRCCCSSTATATCHQRRRSRIIRTSSTAISARATPVAAAARGLDADDFRHPLDKQNTFLLRAIPGLNDMGKALLGPISEQVMVLQNIGSSVLVSEKQLPELHQLLIEAAKTLNTEAPDLYVRQNPVPNAYTLAINGKKPFIVVHTSLVELLTRKELQVEHINLTQGATGYICSPASDGNYMHSLEVLEWLLATWKNSCTGGRLLGASPFLRQGFVEPSWVGMRYN